jgi:tRNA U34 5-carboxymethylaminomethyl modifying GTPase MnmE/TrmE
MKARFNNLFKQLRKKPDGLQSAVEHGEHFPLWLRKPPVTQVQLRPHARQSFSFGGDFSEPSNHNKEQQLCRPTRMCPGPTLSSTARNVHTLGGSPDDTIFALSTPAGRGGLCVVRISGKKASSALQLMLRGRKSLPRPRTATVCEVCHPTQGEVLDKGMVLFFPAPRSFTGEDVVELHLHGSVAVTQAVLAGLGHIQGLRPAQPGEFTRRALLNGKLDLVEAEGLADLLAAGTEVQRKLALRQMGGDASRLYETWRATLVRCLAHTEAFIDFGEDEEIPEQALRGALEDAKSVAMEIRKHCNDARCGEIIREGVQIVLAGPPNAGKSSLLNALARRPAAITNAKPGTTRDLLQVALYLSLSLSLSVYVIVCLCVYVCMCVREGE